MYPKQTHGIVQQLLPGLLLLLFLGLPVATLSLLPLRTLQTNAATGIMTLEPTLASYIGEALLWTQVGALVGPFAYTGYKLARGRAGAFSLKAWHAIVLLFAVWIFFFGGLAMLQQWFQPPTAGTVPFQPVPTPPVPPGFVPFSIGWQFQERNAGDGSSITTSSPSYNVVTSTNGVGLDSIGTLFGRQGNNIASGATNTNIPIEPETNGVIYVEVDTGTTDYPDPAKILSENPYLTRCKWMPVTNANVNELVCESRVPLTSPNPNVVAPIERRLLVSAWLDDLAVTASAPADQDSLGTTAGTDVFIDWELTALASNQAFDFARIWITSNQTTAFGEVRSLTITSSTGQVQMAKNLNAGVSAIYTPAATATTASGVVQFWRFFPTDKDIANDIGDGLLIGRTSSSADSIRIRAHVRVSFAAATDAITAVINVRLISAANGLQTAVTDSVIAGG